MIVKLIILFIAIWFGIRIYRQIQLKKNDTSPDEIQNMVKCDQCGIHLPADEAVRSGEKYFCSQDHLP